LLGNSPSQKSWCLDWSGFEKETGNSNVVDIANFDDSLPSGRDERCHADSQENGSLIVHLDGVSQVVDAWLEHDPESSIEFVSDFLRGILVVSNEDMGEINLIGKVPLGCRDSKLVAFKSRDLEFELTVSLHDIGLFGDDFGLPKSCVWSTSRVATVSGWSSLDSREDEVPVSSLERCHL